MKGWPYEVSDQGRVRRAKPACVGNTRVGKVLRPFRVGGGYLSVRLYGQGGPGYQDHRVHRLVWEAFRGRIPDELEINHLDGDKENNALTNLECVTHQENMRHAFENGFAKNHPGERSSAARLTRAQVEEIVGRLGDDESHHSIAQDYGVSRTTVTAISTGETWAHLPRPPMNHGPRRGERAGQARLTRDEAEEVLRRLAEGCEQKEIAAEFGVSSTTVSHIKTGTTWGHLSRDGVPKKRRVVRLVEAQVRDIVNRLAAGDERDARIAQDYGVARRTIRDIRTRHTWKHVSRGILAVAGVLLATACVGAQTLALSVAEVRHGEAGRQDAAGLEASFPAGSLTLYVEAMGRHGDVDDQNSGHPWLTLTAGRSLASFHGLHLSAVAGLYSTPVDDYARWTPLMGPRLDIATGSRWSLHASHYWRRRGLVQTRMTEWTPRTLFRLDWRILR